MKESVDRPSIIVACAEEPLGRVLAHALRSMGCGVERVTSHKALLLRTRQHHYALILTCFYAPLLSDYRMARLLRGSEGTAIFVLTTSRSANEVVVLLERGVEQVLSLPVSITRLRSKIEHRISKTITL